MTDILELMDDEYTRLRAIDAGIETELLLQRGAAFETLLIHARDEAMAAMETLIHGDFKSLDDVRQQQWEVTRYHDLVRWIQAIMENGNAARSDLSEEEGQMLEMMIRGEPEEKDA
jgi:hypothetical protein